MSHMGQQQQQQLSSCSVTSTASLTPVLAAALTGSSSPVCSLPGSSSIAGESFMYSCVLCQTRDRSAAAWNLCCLQQQQQQQAHCLAATLLAGCDSRLCQHLIHLGCHISVGYVRRLSVACTASCATAATTSPCGADCVL
jgi:hypothetical protein